MQLPVGFDRRSQREWFGWRGKRVHAMSSAPQVGVSECL